MLSEWLTEQIWQLVSAWWQWRAHRKQDAIESSADRGRLSDQRRSSRFLDIEDKNPNDESETSQDSKKLSHETEEIELDQGPKKSENDKKKKNEENDPVKDPNYSLAKHTVEMKAKIMKKEQAIDQTKDPAARAHNLL